MADSVDLAHFLWSAQKYFELDPRKNILPGSQENLLMLSPCWLIILISLDTLTGWEDTRHLLLSPTVELISRKVFSNAIALLSCLLKAITNRDPDKIKIF